MNQTVGWSVKVWLTSVMLAPVLLLLTAILQEPTSGKFKIDLQFIPVVILLSFISSIPCWLALWWCAFILNHYNINIRTQKVLLSFIGAGLTYAILALVSSSGQPSLIALCCYASLIIAGIWYYR